MASAVRIIRTDGNGNTISDTKYNSGGPGVSNTSSSPSTSSKSSSSGIGSSTLKQGSRGDDVKALQSQLISMGYDLGSSGADGIYGTKTANAVKQYQASQGITSDGIVGNQTRSYLNGSGSSNSGNTAYGPSGQAAVLPEGFDSWDDYYEYMFGEEPDEGYSSNGYLKQLYNSQNDAIKAAIQKQNEAQQAAIKAAIDKAVSGYNSQKESTAQDYADMYRQLYINKMNSEKNIGQQLAAMGQTGGAAESTLLGLNTDYSDNLRQGQTSEKNAIALLDKAISEAQLSGDIESANAYSSMLQQMIEQERLNYQNMIAAAQQEYQNKQNEKKENRSYAYQIAMNMLQNGSMPSDNVLSSAGISKTDAATIVAQNTKPVTTSGSGRSGSSGSSNQSNIEDVYRYMVQSGAKQSELDEIWGQMNQNDRKNYFSKYSALYN